MISLYKASAGSGKTYTLAYEYIRLLLSQDQADRYRHILAVTFTKKATAEMKERILKELHLLSIDPDRSPYTDRLTAELRIDRQLVQRRAQRGLHAVLQDYTRFAVLTIDSFFQQVVQSFAREVGLSAQFTISLEQEEIIRQAVDDIFFALNHRQTTEELSTWIQDFALDNISRQESWSPRDKIQEFSNALFTERLQQLLDAMRPLLTDKDLLRRYRQALEAIPDDRDHMRERATADAILKNLNTLGMLSDVWEQIQRTNREQKRLPIDQIKSLLYRIIDDADSPFIYEKIGTRYHHYMIDEFQDTSAMQWQNFRPLVAESHSNGYRNLIVGDVKQSIYRFRNSDWHLLQNLPHEFPDCEQPTMDTNYRSARTIVETNNDLFARYVTWVAEQFEQDKLMPSELGEAVRQAYATLHQQAKRQDLTGRVRLQWFEAENKEHFLTQADQAVLDLLPTLQARHYRMGQVTMLVRNGRDGGRMAELLLRNGYEVESQQGLLVGSHPAVQVLVHLLRLTINPEDDVTRTSLRHAYAQQRYSDSPTALTRFMLSNEPYLTAEQEEAVREAQLLPLYEQVQQLIQSLELHTWPRATAYLTAFQDLIYAYSEQQTAEIGTFLDYWDQKAESAYINSAPSEDAIRIMTIHKSKGLEFDIVILPYMCWDISTGRGDAGKILWCRATQPPFDMLPYVPIGFRKTFSAKREHHLFMQENYEELCNCYIDNLNLSYVAFTRPVRELYGFGRVVKQTQKGPSPQDIGQLLHLLLQDDPDYHDLVFERGEAAPYEAEARKADRFAMPATTLPAAYHVTPIGSRLQLSTRGIQDELSLQDFGTLMHDWLALIRTPEDAEPRLRDMLRDGRVREQDLERMHTEWERFMQLIADRDWFSSDYQVLSERAILTASGRTIRPDRVMLRDRKAVVIDYKFGQHQSPAHRTQVQDYMSQLSQMGYSVEGYLVYVTLSKIVTL
jgi:ATP-dependent exoDNAse (exonuclease V) beta subunit